MGYRVRPCLRTRQNKNKASQLLLVFILRSKSNSNSDYPIAKTKRTSPKESSESIPELGGGDGLELGGVSQ